MSIKTQFQLPVSCTSATSAASWSDMPACQQFCPRIQREVNTQYMYVHSMSCMHTVVYLGVVIAPPPGEFGARGRGLFSLIRVLNKDRCKRR